MSRHAFGITTRFGTLAVLSVAILLLTTRTTLRKSLHATFLTPTQSSSIALTLDNAKLINVNPDVHTVTVFNAMTTPPTSLAEIPVGIDPMSVATNPSAAKAYVANSFSGTLSVIDLNALIVTNTITVGKEPMAVAPSPNGTRLYVANSASNSVSVVNTSSEGIVATIDLSAFGTAPRAVAVTNDGDADDTDETIFVALFFGQLRPGKTSIDEGQDDQREGRVVAISAATNTVLGSPNPVVLGPIANAGFNSNGRLAPANGLIPSVVSTNPQSFTTPTGAFPNQLAAIALQPASGRGYVVSTAASPNGPFRFNHMAQGQVSVFDVATRTEITASQTDPGVRRTAPLNLNQGVNLATTPAPRFFMTNPVAMAWRPNGSDAWVVMQNSDLVVRLTVDGSGVPSVGCPLVAGPSQIVRIDLQNVGGGQLAGKAPRGIVIDSTGTRAFVSSFVSRSVTEVSITSPTSPTIAGTVASSSQPEAGTEEATIQLGAELFYSARGPSTRMSSEAWGSCVVCHPQGRSDNVTWMFDAGPRQTTPLDGTFANGVQRILNWSAVRDEVHDFELNTRGVFGGRGLIDDDRLFFAFGGTSGATPTDSGSIEQFQQFTGVLASTNDLAGGLTLPVLDPRRDFGIATLDDGRVFIFGGRAGAGQGSLTTGTKLVMEFNPRTNALIARSSAGFTPRHSLGAAAVRTPGGPRIYAIGGYTSTLDTQAPSNVVQEYNPATDTWRSVAALPTAVAQFGIAVAGGINTADPRQLVHVVSGNAGTEAIPSLAGNTVQRFLADAAGPGVWSTFSVTGLTPRRNHGAATIQRGVASRIIVVGGQDAAGTVLDTVEEYTNATVPAAVMTPHTSLPAPRARFGIARTLSTNQVYVAGGVDGTGADQVAVFEYTVANNGPVAGPPGTPSGTWVTRANLSGARRGLGLCTPPGVTNLLPVQSAGRDAGQDAINLFVARRIRASRAPVPANDPTAQAGRTRFEQVGLVIPAFSCATCHGEPRWTNSQVDYVAPPSPAMGIGLGNQNVIGAELRLTVAQPSVLTNVGTFAPNTAGGRVNEIRFNAADVGQAIAPLGASGFNIPSLFSVHETAPYFYSGLAQTLTQVLDGSQDGNGGTRHHFVTDPTSRAQLIAFLRSIDSNAFAPGVTIDPNNQTVCPTTPAFFTAAASGSPTPGIQWQQSTNGGATFTAIPGATSSTLIVATNGTQNGYLYRAVFTNLAGKAISNAATLTLNFSNSGPAITTNPVSKTASAGASVTFTAAASGTPAPTVQWESSSDGGAHFASIGGATSTSLTFTASTSDNGRQFRAVFSNTCGVAVTTAATLNVRVFIDSPLSAGILIKRIHIEQLRTRVDEQRSRFGLGAFGYSNPMLTVGVTPVRAVDVTELREALRQAYVAAGLPAPSYTDPTIIPGVTLVKSIHIEELRTNVVALE